MDSMGEIDVHDDIVEEILIRLDAKDLKHYTCVCKLWFSLITSPRFVRRHMNQSCNKDHYNNGFGQRRVTLFKNIDFFYIPRLIGSSNGLVCILYKSKLLLCNPLTREVRQLPSPPFFDLTSCWGFGYDSSVDDYKVVIGIWSTLRGKRYFILLSLKSNKWRFVGEAKFKSFDDPAGVLCNCALHWMISNDDGNTKTSIISYDLSREECKEIHVPNDERYIRCNLGIFKQCLCMFGNYSFSPTYVWLMKKYNVKESWELVKIRHNDETKYDIVHSLGLILPMGDDASWYYSASKHFCLEYMAAPVFVESLVSPHDNARGDPKLIEDDKKGRKKGRSS